MGRDTNALLISAGRNDWNTKSKDNCGTDYKWERR